MKASLYSVRSHLVILVLACVLPAAVMAVALIFYFYERDVTQSRANTIATARAITAALDQHVIGVQASLSVLASSELLRQNNFSGFYERAKGLSINQHNPPIVLVGMDGQQLINTALPLGTPLPKNTGSRILNSVREGRPAFADLLFGQALRKPVVVVGVPVIQSGAIAYALTAPIEPAQLRDLLIRQDMPPNWIASIVDGHGKIIARTVDHEKFLGTDIRPALFKHMQEVNEDSVEGTTLEGIPVLGAFSHSPLSHWSVLIGVPRSELTGRLRHSLWMLLAGTALVLAGSLSLAWLYTTRITRTIHALTGQAAALGRGETVAPAHVDFREAGQLSKAFEDAADKLVKTNTALVQRNLDLQQFAFVASHDLRTPLTSVSGYLSMLQKRYASALDEKGHELIQRAGNAVRQMDRLTEDLLSYARLDARAQQNTIIDCKQVLNDTLEFLDAAIRQTGAQIEVPAELPTIHGDRGQLVEVFQNLLGNALKYCKGAAPRIQVKARRGAGEWIFSVTDKGIGIDPIHQQRIFEVFKRLHTAQEYPGNGIGLAICQRIVERHGGRIWVESQAGKGSTFYFSIPDGRVAAT